MWGGGVVSTEDGLGGGRTGHLRAAPFSSLCCSCLRHVHLEPTPLSVWDPLFSPHLSAGLERSFDCPDV